MNHDCGTKCNTIFASYGIVKGEPLCCFYHSKLFPNYRNVSFSECIAKDCKEKRRFGADENNPTHCDEHNPGFPEVVRKHQLKLKRQRPDNKKDL